MIRKQAAAVYSLIEVDRFTVQNSYRSQKMPAIIPRPGDDDDDDWETDPDFVNNMSEEQQRWGGARDTGVLDMNQVRRPHIPHK